MIQYLTPIDRLIPVTEAFYHVTREKLFSPSRTAHVSHARQAMQYALRQLTEMSFPEIGRHFNRDHSSVFHACKSMEHQAGNGRALEVNRYMHACRQALEARSELDVLEDCLQGLMDPPVEIADMLGALMEKAA